MTKHQRIYSRSLRQDQSKNEPAQDVNRKLFGNNENDPSSRSNQNVGPTTPIQERFSEKPSNTQQAKTDENDDEFHVNQGEKIPGSMATIFFELLEKKIPKLFSAKP